MTRLGNSIFLAFLLAAATAAAEPRVAARVSATEVALGGAITLTYEVYGVSSINTMPDLQLPDFQVERAGQVNSFQIINGQMTSMVGFNYVLRPTKAGALRIPPIALELAGKSYASDEISISVVGNDAPSASRVDIPEEGLKPVFLTAKTSARKAAVGQEILLSVQFLKLPDIQLSAQPRYVEPDLTGFIVEPMAQREFTTTINGRPYQVTELRYALFPTAEGDFAIGSAELEVALRADPDPFDPNSFFQSFFGRSQAVRLKTRAIPIHVRALPKARSAAFSGAVGRYRLQVKPDTDAFEVGKPFNLVITVEGQGNVRTLKEPALPDLPGFRKYETVATTKIDNKGASIKGVKEFRTPLIPLVSGPATIPPVSITYFNPETFDYESDSSAAIQITVKPGDPSAAPQAPLIATAPALEGVKVVERSIRFIKDGGIRTERPALPYRPAYWLTNMVPVIFLLAAAWIRRRAIAQQLNAPLFRSRGALRRAQRDLSRLRKRGSSVSDAAYAEIDRVAACYLADKLDMSAAGLIEEDVERRLSERGGDDATLVELRALREEAALARFAPSADASGDASQCALKMAAILRRIEEQLS